MKKGKKAEPVTESETTENEFSEVETKVESRTLNKQGSTLQKIKKNFENVKEDTNPLTKQHIDRNVPINVKANNFKVRTFWTLIMLVVFIGIILAGHIYCTILILLINTGMVKEILSLKRNRERDYEVQFSLFLNWYFYAVAIFYFYGKLFSTVLVNVTLKNKIIYALVAYHDFITFALWITGFLMFTLSLKKGFLRYQFRQFGWVHICMILIVGQGTAIVNNVHEGIIWFILPCLLVISNDVFAYLFGIVIGRTQLIALSPKKTVEGFIGGTISTMVFAALLSKALSHTQYLICPQHQLTFVPFEALRTLTCTAPLTFNTFAYQLPSLFGGMTINISEFQIHAVILGLFTSFVSPFGGFFASGFKRAIKVKDFGDIIPGHGGITDRMDCQIITGTFVYLYIQQIVNGRINYANGVTRFIMNEMDGPRQLLLFNALKSHLDGKGLLTLEDKN